MDENLKSKRKIPGKVTPVLISLMGTALIVYFNAMMRYFIETNLVLDENGYVGKKWATPSSTSKIQFYLFNITNPKDVPDGSRPILQEIGPYYLNMTSTKEITEWNQTGGTVSYLGKTMASFDEESSKNGGEEVVNLINVPVSAMITYMKENLNSITFLAANLAVTSSFSRRRVPLMHKYTVKSLFVDGIKAKFIADTTQAFSSMFPKINEILQDGKINLLNIVNNGAPEEVILHTGTEQPYTMGEVVSVKGSRHMTVWGNEYCNMINGSSNGMSYRRPVVEEHQYMFVSGFCRSLKMDFVGNEKINGIPMRKYIFDSVFTSQFYLPDNMCFCNGLPFCKLLNGVIPLGPCLWNLPVYLSLPHFYKGDPRLYNAIEGLTPDAEKHESYFYINEMLAVPLQVRLALQINLRVTNNPNYAITKNVKTMMLPLAWINLTAGIVGSGYEDYAWAFLIIMPTVIQCLGGLLACYGVVKVVSPEVLTRRKKGMFSTTKVVPINIEQEGAYRSDFGAPQAYS